jgi:hypothetical protein
MDVSSSIVYPDGVPLMVLLFKLFAGRSSEEFTEPQRVALFFTDANHG